MVYTVKYLASTSKLTEPESTRVCAYVSACAAK